MTTDFAGTSVVKTLDNDSENDSLRALDLQEVQVVSTRASKKTPMAYTNLSQAQIREVNHGKDIPSVLNMLTSVTTSSDAGTGIGYTGIHVRGTDPTRINITANGIPMNDAESSQLYWVNMGDFASSVQSIQVQRGVGTSTNGAGAFGATVNMLTENVGIQPFAGVDFSAGSYGTHKETVRFSTGLLNEHWGLQGRLSNIGSDGYIDRASSRLNSYFLQGGYFGDNTMVKLVTFNGTERTYHAWDYASRADMQRYGRTYNPCGQYTNAEGQTAYYDNQTDNYHQQHYQLIWNQRINHGWNLNAALHYTHGDGYYEQYKTSQKLYKYLLSSELGSRSDLVRQKKMLNDFYGAVASFNYDNRRGLQANLGGGWNKYDGDHFGRLVWVREFSGAINPDHEYYRNNAKKTDGNIYGKLNYELLPGLNAFADMQYRHVSYKMSGTSQEFDDNSQQRPLDLDRNYDFFNPKAGLTYNFSNGHQAYISYAIAHKEPTRNDFEDMLSETDMVDPKAERLNDLEIGYTLNAKRLTLNANAYYMAYDNQFVLTGAQDSNGEMVARNIKDSYRAGIELTADWKPVDGLEWNVNATWSKNRAKDMQLTVINEDWSQSYVNAGTTHLAYSPDFILGSTLAYEWKGLRAALLSKYISEQYMTNSGFKSYLEDDGTETRAMIDAMFVNDFDLSYTFKWKAIKSATVGVTVYNLFNERYESNGSCSMNFRNNNGKIEAYNGGWAWATFSAQAPTHFLAHLSVTF
ncbi:MAG: TonB-dependent receptor [Prevotella sp.]|nr:TonB-dependent receptor [Prevotella sp.]